jgi:sigma-B regulation protein RsbU (phosphoserine phosphatase)
MLAYHGVYRRFDLLAVIFAVMTAETATSAASLLAQPSAPLRAAGAYALVTLGVLLALALVGAWRGREVPQEFFEAADQAASRAARERLRAEFDVARRAQEQMLPSAPPALPGYQIAATCQPAKEVGGDLYDFLPLLDGRLGIVVADVSGKGVPASLYMTLTKGLLASVAEERVDPGEILREVNRHLYEVCRQKIFVTVFLGVIDPVARTLTYARAGHNPPVWHRAALASATLLRAPGLGLGLNGGQLFNRILAVERIRLEPDDTLFFYSDGITEAMNASGEPYGEERLLAIAARTDGLGAEAARDAVLADVGAFLGETPPQDDQTLVVVRVNTDSISERLLVR